MKFRKRMKPIVRDFEGIPYEAISHHKTERGARIVEKRCRFQGFNVQVTFERGDWYCWFVWVSIIPSLLNISE